MSSQGERRAAGVNESRVSEVHAYMRGQYIALKAAARSNALPNTVFAEATTLETRDSSGLLVAYIAGASEAGKFRARTVPTRSKRLVSRITAKASEGRNAKSAPRASGAPRCPARR